MTDLVVVLALGAICWVFRIVFVLLVPATALPSRIRRGLDHLAPAVLAGIAAVELTSTVGSGDLRSNLLALGAMALVAGIAHRFRNLSLTVVAALAAVLLIDLLVR
ncbi:AzlD domain-containing protein [Modestobacter sp. I12A-02662]|uniref:AzlD domain-containing protein n=1 Tax=Modestobacter sp. I12A-02662 TaxID=1730496 RepID=UPI0034E00870